MTCSGASAGSCSGDDLSLPTDNSFGDDPDLGTLDTEDAQAAGGGVQLQGLLAVDPSPPRSPLSLSMPTESCASDETPRLPSDEYANLEQQVRGTPFAEPHVLEDLVKLRSQLGRWERERVNT